MFGSEPAWPRLQTKGSILDNICLTGLVETVSLEPGIRLWRSERPRSSPE